MTLSEARCRYSEFMARMDVAFAFGAGCTMDGAHPALAELRAEADRLLAQVRALEAVAGKSLNPPGRTAAYDFNRN